MSATSGPTGLFVWAITKSQAASFSTLISELAEASQPAHVYLDSPCNTLAVVVSMGEHL